MSALSLSAQMKGNMIRFNPMFIRDHQQSEAEVTDILL